MDTEGTNYKILYTFDKTEQEKISYKLNSEDSYPDSMSISAKAFDKCWKQLAKLELKMNISCGIIQLLIKILNMKMGKRVHL